MIQIGFKNGPEALPVLALSFFDFIRELRKGEPDPKKAAKAVKILGWICVCAGLWNYLMYHIAPFDETPLKLPAINLHLALIIGTSAGALFLFSARGIREGAQWGKRLGQLAVILSVVLLVGAMFVLFPRDAIPRGGGLSLIFAIVIVLFVTQLFAAGYFGIRYLGRLPVKDDIYSDPRCEPEYLSKMRKYEVSIGSPTRHEKYKDSPSPLGILGTFALLIAVPLITLLIIEKYAGPEKFALVFMPTFLLMFLSPVVYNLLPSPFERKRSLIASYTGGGSIYLFSGTWPFFRLMIYKDGIEIRVMFHRFLIPYDKMADLPPKIGFFSMSLLIKSDLPDVPSNIRYSGFGMKKILEVVKENRKKYMDKIQKDVVSGELSPYGGREDN